MRFYSGPLFPLYFSRCTPRVSSNACSASHSPGNRYFVFFFFQVHHWTELSFQSLGRTKTHETKNENKQKSHPYISITNKKLRSTYFRTQRSRCLQLSPSVVFTIVFRNLLYTWHVYVFFISPCKRVRIESTSEVCRRTGTSLVPFVFNDFPHFFATCTSLLNCIWCLNNNNASIFAPCRRNREKSFFSISKSLRNVLKFNKTFGSLQKHFIRQQLRFRIIPKRRVPKKCSNLRKGRLDEKCNNFSSINRREEKCLFLYVRKIEKRLICSILKWRNCLISFTEQIRRGSKCPKFMRAMKREIRANLDVKLTKFSIFKIDNDYTSKFRYLHNFTVKTCRTRASFMCIGYHKWLNVHVRAYIYTEYISINT